MLRDAAGPGPLRGQFTLSLVGTVVAFTAAGLVHASYDRTLSLLPALARSGSYEAYQGSLDAANFLAIALVITYGAALASLGVTAMSFLAWRSAEARSREEERRDPVAERVEEREEDAVPVRRAAKIRR